MSRFPLVLLLFLCIGVVHALAQPGDSSQLDRSLLTIMVIPYTGPGDTSKRSTIERNELCRNTLGQANRVFTERGYRTKDYLAVLKQPQVAPDIAELERTEVKEAIRSSKVDVVIHIEIKWRVYPAGDQQVQLRIQAIDPYSAEHFAESIGVESTRRFYQDYTQACREAQLIKQLGGFADQLDRKFVDILRHGRTATVRVKALSSSKIKLSTIVDGTALDLSGNIDTWMRTRARRLYPAASDNEVWEAECKVPVVDAEGRFMTPFNLRSDLRTYLTQLRFDGLPLKIKEAAAINSVIEIVLE